MSRDCPLQNPSVCKAYQCQQRGLEQKECVQSWASVCKHHLEILYLIFPARWSQRIKNFIHGFYWIGLLTEGTLKANCNITSRGPVLNFLCQITQSVEWYFHLCVFGLFLVVFPLLLSYYGWFVYQAMDWEKSNFFQN